MDEEKVKQAVRKFTKDAAMKKQFQSAPSAAAKRLRELSFYYMWYDGFRAPRLTNDEEAECFAEMVKTQQQMDLIDWSYIYKCTISKGFKEICRIHVDMLRCQQVPAEDWEFLMEHLPDYDPFKETAKAKLAECKAQG